MLFKQGILHCPAKIVVILLTFVVGLMVCPRSAKANLTYTFTSSSGYVSSGSNISVGGKLNLSLGFAPTPGTNLTVIKNTGLPFISGTFDGVPQGGTVPLTYNGVTYNYIANYFGGNGRSLVLQWPCVGVVAWGRNDHNQLGAYYIGRNDSSTPTAVNTSDALGGKTVFSIAGGAWHSLALTSDGNVFAWGSNWAGQLGDNSTTDHFWPMAVTGNGVLAGKTVVAIASGWYHSLALTADGQVFAWGNNDYGQLGNSSTTSSSVPVAVTASGALAGKTVVAIAAGCYFSLALTSNGQIFAWGANNSGQLGNNSTNNSSVPTDVDTIGALAGKTVVAIAGNGNHCLALTSDGQVFAWGDNGCGQQGNNSTTDNLVPTAVDTTGVLAGKIVLAIAAGGYHSLAITSDGQVFAWGYNTGGELSKVPMAVSATGALSNKTTVAIVGGATHSLALTSDGQVFAWGDNGNGQLGNNSFTNSAEPIEVNESEELSGKKVMAIGAGYSHSLALFGSGPPTVKTGPLDTQLTQSGTTVTLYAGASYNPWPTVQWQVSTTGTAGPFSDVTDNPTATTWELTLNNVTTAQNGYAYRAVFTNNAGSSTTDAATISFISNIGFVLPLNITVNATRKDGSAVTYNVTAYDTVDGTQLTPVCTPPSGSTFPIGTTTVNCSATNSIGTSTASFTITVLRSYAWFQSLYGLPANADLTTDPYGTGVSLLAAYAFGINPAAPNRAQLPLESLQNGFLQIAYPRWIDSGDLSYIVEVSGDMITWSSGNGTTQIISVTPIDATREQVIVSDLVPVSNAVHRFIRVRIQK